MDEKSQMGGCLRDLLLAQGQAVRHSGPEWDSSSAGVLLRAQSYLRRLFMD